ncbi:MAG: Ig-like domain-containing protein [Candidatus Bathyarchaeia archaeon]
MKSILPLLLLIIILASQLPVQVGGQAGTRLSLYVAPDKLAADGGLYESLLIRLEDENGPTVAPSDIPIILTSSDEKVASVDLQLTMPKGHSYIVTGIRTTKTPGTVTITAASPWIPAASIMVTTITPTGAPTKLGIYAGPTSILAEPTQTSYITVRLEDARGLPAKSPSDIEVSLTLSEPKVGSIDSYVIIRAGEFQTATTFRATYTPGSTKVTASVEGYPVASVTITTVGTAPTKLAVYALPSSLHIQDKPGLLIVQLQGDTGNLAKAPSDILVTLTSNSPNIANPEGPATIRKGESQAVSYLIPRSAAGQVIITAAAEGYTLGSTTITISAETGSASSASVTIAGCKIPSDRGSYKVIAIQLLTSGGKPAKASYLTLVAVSSSNSEVGSVSSDLVYVEGGSSYTIATFKTTHKPGTTTITATASGYSATAATLTTVGSSPTKIGLITTPPNIYADNATYKSLVVQLQDSTGAPVKAPNSLTVSLYSSNLEVGSVDPSITIHAGSSSAVANFYSTRLAGSTTISSLAEGYTVEAATVTTYKPEPQAFALFALPSEVYADGTSYDSIYIQPRDSAGLPAIPWSDITVHLTSSNYAVGDVDPTVNIPAGKSLVVTKFHSGFSTGETTINALSSGLSATTLKVSTIPALPTGPQISVTVKATPEIIHVGGESILEITAMSGGNPLPNAKVELSVDLGSLSATSLTTGMNGQTNAIYSSNQQGEATVTVTVSKQGYQSCSETLGITVSEAPLLTSNLVYLLTAAGAAAAVTILLLRSGRLRLPIKLRLSLPK